MGPLMISIAYGLVERLYFSSTVFMDFVKFGVTSRTINLPNAVVRNDSLIFKKGPRFTGDLLLPSAHVCSYPVNSHIKS